MRPLTLADQNLQSRIEYGTHFVQEVKAADSQAQEEYSQQDDSNREQLKHYGS